MLLHRAFLVLVAEKCRDGKPCTEVILKPASVSVRVAEEIVHMSTSLLKDRTSPVLKAATFQLLTCLCNSVSTLMLYWSNALIVDSLKDFDCSPTTAVSTIMLAIETFEKFQHLFWIDQMSKKLQSIMGTAGDAMPPEDQPPTDVSILHNVFPWHDLSLDDLGSSAWELSIPSFDEGMSLSASGDLYQSDFLG